MKRHPFAWWGRVKHHLRYRTFFSHLLYGLNLLAPILLAVVTVFVFFYALVNPGVFVIVILFFLFLILLGMAND
ncbi:hypothetical protein [Calditerricola satsumensis]|uniref:Uncharacterized protein n=1 Tax=Calditerricola satsumensis TaxID=373054 RepID=A0A8J3B7A8_9BACI|nr:hypothetical protein [Calditerricola satsumensis]GGJ98493.1 hypothetical protein GCM10007043_10580 [Calditerricola satsumensis]